MKRIRKIITLLLMMCMITTVAYVPVSAAPAGEVHGVWITFMDMQKMLQGKTQDQFDALFTGACDKALAHTCTDLLVHVRSHNDAIYPSAIYPWSTRMLLGADPGFDPLADMVSIAHSKGLKIHAWINPYGYRNGVYENPQYVTQDNIVNGVAEIVNNYAVDGVHFDDYFPPVGAGVNNQMIQRVYQTAHAAGKVFGISPQGNVENNIAMGADVRTWLSVPGYIDYLTPQIYWSDNYSAAGNVTMFTNRLNQWTAMNTAGIPMYVGLGAYRGGSTLTSDRGWAMRSDNLLTQANAAAAKGWRGYFIYSYDSLNSPVCQAELQNLLQR